MFGIAWCSKGGGRRSGEGQRCQKIVPGGEDQEGGDGSQVFEEAAARAHLLHPLAPEIFGQITDATKSWLKAHSKGKCVKIFPTSACPTQLCILTLMGLGAKSRIG